MLASDLLNEYRLAGLLLISAFVVFAIGGALPVVGEKGNSGIFTLPVQEHLLAVAGNAVMWRWANILMGVGALILLAGLRMLTTLLEGASEHLLSRVGLVGFLLAAALWVIFSAFRATATIRAALEMSSTDTPGAVLAYYEPLAQWGGALFYGYAVVGFLALAAYGGALLQVNLVPAWVGWITIGFSVLMLIQLFITGDTLPAFHYLPPLLIGILLVLQR